MGEFATHHAVIDKKPKGPSVLVVGAHHDDEKMLNLEDHLTRRGIGVTRLTLTNSDGRNLPSYTQDELPSLRWKEGIVSGQITGVSDVHRIDIPDGHLSAHIKQAVNFGRELVNGQVAIFAPNKIDEHPDHRAAYVTALELGGNAIAVYQADTLNGLGLHGELLVPDIYVPLTRRNARREKRSYLAHESQTFEIPPEQRPAMFDALGMTRRRGAEIGILHAAVLFNANDISKNIPDRLTEVFSYKNKK